MNDRHTDKNAVRVTGQSALELFLAGVVWAELYGIIVPFIHYIQLGLSKGATQLIGFLPALLTLFPLFVSRLDRYRYIPARKIDTLFIGGAIWAVWAYDIYANWPKTPPMTDMEDLLRVVRVFSVGVPPLIVIMYVTGLRRSPTEAV